VDPPPLPHLETFAAAAERGSFTAAARDLGVTQAAVSQRVQALERVLGVPLFARAGGGALLTDAGRRLHAYARRILALHREARRRVGGRAAPVGGELTLAASSVPGEHLLPALLARFRRRHPHVRVRAAVADTRAVLEQVERGRAQVGLVGGRGDSPHLEYRPFAADRLVLVVPAGHAWGGRRVSLRQLAGRPLVLREPGSATRACLERALAAAGLAPERLRVALELGSNEAVKAAVLRGAGPTFLSRLAVRRELRDGRLRPVSVAGLGLRRDVLAVWDRRRVLPTPARLFLDLLGPRPGAAGAP
jgi:molybdate transport repressor ModE-like protein